MKANARVIILGGKSGSTRLSLIENDEAVSFTFLRVEGANKRDVSERECRERTSVLNARGNDEKSRASMIR